MRNFEIIHNHPKLRTIVIAMPAMPIYPVGWLNAALEVTSYPWLPAAGSAVAAGETGSEMRAAWDRLQEIEKGMVPRIFERGQPYRVVDVERTSPGDGILLYTRAMERDRDNGLWGLFFQEGVEDREPVKLTRRQIQDHLLQVYTDTNLYVLPEEITYSEPTLDRSSAGWDGSQDGSTMHDVSLQNGHGLRIFYGPGYDRPSLKGLFNFLRTVPLAALNQIDEIRMIQEDNARIGDTFREGNRLVNVFYSLGPVGASEEEQKDFFVKFLYAVLHETFGHGLMYRNRFLRREMIRIVCSGEEPPSDYARSSIEEWFPEGVAERGVRVFFNHPEIGAWDQRYRYLSGLIRHLLGVLEERVEPANENIALWRDSLRPIEP